MAHLSFLRMFSLLLKDLNFFILITEKWSELVIIFVANHCCRQVVLYHAPICFFPWKIMQNTLMHSSSAVFSQICQDPIIQNDLNKVLIVKC